MNIAITFRQMEASDAVKTYASDKVAKLQRFLRQSMKGQVTVSCQNHRFHTVEIDIHCGSDHFHASETSEDMYATVDKAADKIERQIRAAKDSATTKLKGSARASDYLMADLVAGDLDNEMI